MKTLTNFFIGTLLLLVAVACDDKESEHGDSQYASQASISSSDSQFAPTSAGGTITFGVDGGQVVVNVNCEIDWTATNSSPDWLDVSANSEYGRLIISAGQNTATEQQTATVTLTTANEGIKFAEITVIQEPYEISAITVDTTEYNFPAVGALSVEIAVTANADWTIQNSSLWLTTEKTDIGILLTASENENLEDREVELILTCTDGISSASATIAVTQDGKVYLNASGDTLKFFGDADSNVIEIESNFEWECSYDTTNDWFSVEQNGNGFTVYVLEYNEGVEAREGTIVVTAGDRVENVAEVSIHITQYSLDAMVLEYTTSDENVQVVLPLGGTVSCTIDWDDGSDPEEFSTTNPNHTYDVAGVHYVTVTGKVTSLNSSGSTTTKEYITGVKQWGQTGLTTLYNAFNGCSNLKYLPKHTGSSLSGLSNSLNMHLTTSFASCTSLESIPEDLFADCPKATYLSRTFYQCSSLKEIPEGLFSNGAVISMNGAFQDCIGLTSLPAGLFDNCNSLINLQNAFSNCSNLSGETPYTEVNGVKVHLYERSAENGFTAISTYSGCFSGCINLSDYSDIPTGWK